MVFRILAKLYWLLVTKCSALFVRNHNRIAVIVCVEYIIITGDNTEEIFEVKGYLSKVFEIKDLGLSNYLLMDLMRSEEGDVFNSNSFRVYQGLRNRTANPVSLWLGHDYIGLILCGKHQVARLHTGRCHMGGYRMQDDPG